LADLGYESIAVTLDVGPLNPYAPEWFENLAELDALLKQRRLASVIETGARFLLDPERKHFPTLLTPDEDGRERRVAFLRTAIDTAEYLGSDAVSLWSGALPEGMTEQAAYARLAVDLEDLLKYAAERAVTLAFEPEPGMFIDTMARFAELVEWVDAPNFKLTLDVGHLHCQGETPIAAYIDGWSTRVANVHIEDMRSGVHEHLQFGEGEMNFPPILQALREAEYRGGLHVELSRHSHDAQNAARKAYEFLKPLLPG
jgi:sugar phosphate isomerase/epimerase